MTSLSPAGERAPFPPRTPDDIDAYDERDLVEGFRSHDIDDLEPGPNHAPGFRWGWLNRRRDSQREDDGFDALRHAYLRARRKH